VGTLPKDMHAPKGKKEVVRKKKEIVILKGV
jgi:hypothetical protein